MTKQIIITASIFGVIAVITGAFGAHGLKDKLSVGDLEIWKTAVSYQFYHLLALFFLACLPNLKPGYVSASYIFFTLGIVCFSGSLYLLATRSVTGITFTKLLGPVTPVGGLFFILGWVLLIVAALKGK